MIDVEYLRAHAPKFLEDVKEHIQNDAEDRTDEDMEAQIAGMSIQDAFGHYLEWNGIVGWTDSIWRAVVVLLGAYSEGPSQDKDFVR